jgi:hypothetical protein
MSIPDTLLQFVLLKQPEQVQASSPDAPENFFTATSYEPAPPTTLPVNVTCVALPSTDTLDTDTPPTNTAAPRLQPVNANDCVLPNFADCGFQFETTVFPAVVGPSPVHDAFAPSGFLYAASCGPSEQLQIHAPLIVTAVDVTLVEVIWKQPIKDVPLLTNPDPFKVQVALAPRL